MNLAVVLWVKIVFTFCLWSLPLLLFPVHWLRRLGFPDLTPFLIFVKLLGAAFFALLVGYALGLGDLYAGKDVANTVRVGIVSNGSACLILLLFGSRGAWSGWGGPARLILWLSAGMTGLITLGLFWYGIVDPAR